jgi:putative transposase
MGDLIRKSHNVSLLMYHIVCVATYRRLVITDEIDSVLKPVCIEISKRLGVTQLHKD